MWFQGSAATERIGSTTSLMAIYAAFLILPDLLVRSLALSMASCWANVADMAEELVDRGLDDPPRNIEQAEFSEHSDHMLEKQRGLCLFLGSRSSARVPTKDRPLVSNQDSCRSPWRRFHLLAEPVG